MNEKPFTITSFQWRKEIEQNLGRSGAKMDSDEKLVRVLSGLARFLDENGLTTRKLTDGYGSVDRSFELNSTDLTPEGLRLIRKGYESWFRRSDKNPEDVRSLEKALHLIRTESEGG